MHLRLHDLLVAQPPSAPAMQIDADSWTYADLLDEVRTQAAALLAMGVRRGDRVAALLPPSPPAWISFLATAAIGAIWVGLNPRYRPAEISHVLDNAEPRLLLTIDEQPGPAGGGHLQDIAATRPKLLVLRADDGSGLLEKMASLATARSRAFLDAAMDDVAPRDPCLIVYTSGSTGAPKGALLHHHGICRFAQTQNKLWPCRDFRILNFLPINHIGSIVDVGATALAAGGLQLFQPQFDTAGSLALMAENRLTVWGAVPSVFRMQLDHPDFARTDISAVDLIIWGGAAMPRPLIDRLRAICPRLATNYGMTETSSAITSLGPTDDADRLETSVGQPFPGVEVRLDPDTGEILARSDLNFLGYWRAPEATAAAFTADGFFRTGDAGEWLPDGSLKLTGRTKDMLKSGGYNIWPAEIEAALEAHPDVEQAVLVGVPDPQWQEVGLAFVIIAPGAPLPDLGAWCRERMANYKIPKHFRQLATFPLLPIGKVDRVALRAEALRSSPAS